MSFKTNFSEIENLQNEAHKLEKIEDYGKAVKTHKMILKTAESGSDEVLNLQAFTCAKLGDLYQQMSRDYYQRALVVAQSQQFPVSGDLGGGIWGEPPPVLSGDSTGMWGSPQPLAYLNMFGRHSPKVESLHKEAQELERLKDYDKAVEKQKMILEIAKSESHIALQISTLVKLGDLYHQMSRTQYMCALVVAQSRKVTLSGDAGSGIWGEPSPLDKEPS
ncbi:MAG: hypothetical protein ABG776_09215 [Cyanobacteria bacterium J06555_13]